MKTTYHIPVVNNIAPARGDLLQTNLGDRRERTWFILSVKRKAPRFCRDMGCITDRFELWAERWWEIEPETRMALFRSAERRGGQITWPFHRFKAKPKKRGFEEVMRVKGFRNSA